MSSQQHVLPLSFFDRPVLEVCPELLGHFLVIRLEGRIVRVEVLEIEAYDGQEDLACHASRGKTPRNAPLFGPAGYWYVYLCYGIHWLLNIVTGPVGYPAAILIRGVGSFLGPGILTRELKIDKRFNELPSGRSTGLWLERNPHRPQSLVYETTPRIGVDYAGKWAHKPYRFIKPKIDHY
ncbi:MAG: DNA-3-methyladenine glycosylase [Opitutae bacterium]|nr:DNA-3-methyladenine glycosylase [Opitutae bacterium]